MGYDEFAALERGKWTDPGIAGSYAAGFDQATARCVPVLVEEAGAGPGMAALDLCCGHGVVAEGLAGAGCEVTMLDFSPAMLAMARARVPGARAVEGDAGALPFEDASFDAATMGFGILHLPDPDAALREAARVLRPGARIALSNWLPPERNLAFRAVFGSIAERGDPSVALPEGPDMFAFAARETAFPRMEAAGLTDLRLSVADTGWETDDPSALFRFFETGTARGAALIGAQPPGHREAIRAAVEETLRDALGAPPWRIASPSAVVSGAAPA